MLEKIRLALLDLNTWYLAIAIAAGMVAAEAIVIGAAHTITISLAP